MIESLGAGDGFRNFHDSLAQKYSIKMIRVYADLDTCLERVRSRSKLDHIDVSDDKVIEYNRVAATVKYDWALEIDNNRPAPDAENSRGNSIHRYSEVWAIAHHFRGSHAYSLCLFKLWLRSNFGVVPLS